MKLSPRIRYFIGHLLISFIVSLCSVMWVFLVWYPAPLASAVGVTAIFLMMVAIDVVVGPTLSLLVYKVGKKTLKMDLTVIIILQIIALGYGIHSIAEGRPAWIVYNVDRFELVRHNEIHHSDAKNSDPTYHQPSWFRPKMVATAFSADSDEQFSNLLEESMAGISLAQRPERYVSLETATEQMLARALPLTDLATHNPKNQVDATLKHHPTATAYLPLKANHQDMTVLIDQQGKVLKIVNLRPWEAL